MTLLNDKTILKPGMLAETTTNDKWGSCKYWNRNNMEWEYIAPCSPILILNISYMRVDFLYKESLFSIHNCYNDQEGNPFWCIPYEHRSW